jgi:hypothetical protein
MKVALLFIVSLAVLGCSQEGTRTIPVPPGPSPVSPAPPPPAPPPPVPTPGSLKMLWGAVISPTGECIEGATVEVVGGQRLGDRLTQTTPCGAWDFDAGFQFHNLTAGQEMTLRASAPGWRTAEKTIVPLGGAIQVIYLELSRVE